MAMTVHLPDELRERLATEAARRGKSVDALVAEMVAKQLPPQLPADTGEDALEAFIGCGSSGRGDVDRGSGEAEADATVERPSRRLSFIGVGASGGRESVAERHREIIREHFARKTARDV
jgi:hypothetical protein